LKSCINLTNDEATMLANKKSGDKIVLLRVMKEQPPERAEVHNHHSELYYVTSDEPDYWNPLLCPYQVGLFGLRETWRPHGKSICPPHWSVEYKFPNHYGQKVTIHYEEPPEWMLKVHNFITWRSPATMPEDAIRSWLNVQEIGCVRVQNLSYDDLMLHYTNTLDDSESQEYFRKTYTSLVYKNFADHWNTAHGKPVKSGDGLRWENNPYIWILKGNIIIGEQAGNIFKKE